MPKLCSMYLWVRSTVFVEIFSMFTHMPVISRQISCQPNSVVCMNQFHCVFQVVPNSKVCPNLQYVWVHFIMFVELYQTLKYVQNLVVWLSLCDRTIRSRTIRPRTFRPTDNSPADNSPNGQFTHKYCFFVKSSGFMD